MFKFNLAQERNVGCINYGFAISGKENLTTVSQRNVIKTAADLITDCKPDNYKKYIFQAKEIKDVMKQWNEKMAILQKQGYNEKKVINAKEESNKLKDVTYLKVKFHLDPLVQLMRYAVTLVCH